MSDVGQFIKDAFECSVYVSPRDVGLKVAEIQEAAKLAGYRVGETNDALRSLCRFVGDRCFPNDDMMFMFGGASIDFNERYEPDFRKWEAFEFVRQELLEVAKDVGAANAILPRDVLVERGVAKGLERHDVEVAVTVTLLAGILKEKDGGVFHSNKMYALPSQQVGHQHRFTPRARPTLARTQGIVRDIIERRTDGRPAASNPLDAFESCLGAIGHERFRAWWIQQRHELRLAGPMQPTTSLVLAASLAEAALAFVVPRAQKHGLMSRIDITRPRQWGFDDLVKGAKSGNPAVDPILDEPTSSRVLQLNSTRQRIHAGFLIDTVANGPIPDLKPEEARDGVQTAEIVVRRVVEWLGRHPA